MYFIEIPSWLELNHPSLNKQTLDKSNKEGSKVKLIIALDAKYQQTSDNKSDVLSYQYSCFFIPRRIYSEGVIYTDEKYSRLTLNEIIIKIIKNLGLKWSDAKNIEILIITHFSKMFYSSLKDRKKISSSSIYEIQDKGFCSFKNFPLKLQWDSKNLINSSIMWRDTILVSPEKDDKDLDKLSTMTTNKKESIPFEFLDHNVLNGVNLKLLLEKNKNLYKKYVLKYPRIILEYYFGFISNLWKNSGLVFFPTTTGDITSNWFLKDTEERSIKKFENNGGKFQNLKKIKAFEIANYYREKLFGEERRLVFKSSDKDGNKRTSQVVKKLTFNRNLTEYYAVENYTGACNVALHRGEIREEDGYLNLDFDFTNAYATVAADLPMIDWEQDDRRDFNVIDHIKAKQKLREDYAAIGYFYVEFEFEPSETYMPCIPVRTESGLRYPYKGKSMCTYAELALAVWMNCKITVLSGIIFKELVEDGEPVMAFSDYLAKLVKLRNEAKKEFGEGSLQERFFKDCYTNLYGKLCKSREQKNSKSLKGISGKIPTSQIALPQHATVITGVIRAAVIELINVFQSLGYLPLSITTDGFMVAIPKKSLNFELEVDENGKVRQSSLKKLLSEQIFPNIFSKIENLYAIQILESGRKRLGLGSDSWIEIKHAGDASKTYKTRANYITHQGKDQTIMRGNLSRRLVNDSESMKQYEGDGKFIEQIRFPSVRVMNEKDWDYVPLMDKDGNYVDEYGNLSRKKINLGVDSKRVYFDDGTSRAPKDINEINELDSVVLHYKKRHKEPTPDRIALRMAGKDIRVGKDTWLTVAKLFIGAVLQENWWENKLTYEKLKDVLNAIFTELNIDSSVNVFTLKNWKKGKIYWNNLPDNLKYRTLWNRIARDLKIPNPDEKFKDFINKV